MRKKFLIFLVSIIALSPFGAMGSYGQQSAQTYLQARSGNPWSTMGLVALGAGNIPTDYLKTASGAAAIDFAAPILALTATGNDPRTFGSQDLVAKLKSFNNAGQLGDSAALNDDIFGIMALVSAGEPLSDTAITDSKNFLLSRQNANGGWGFTTGGASDSNMTAAGIVALISAGLPASDTHIQSALDYLKTAQQGDGGFTYDPAGSYGVASDSSSTAWAMWALNSLSINPGTWSKGNNNPITYLESNQDQSGFFKYQAGSNEDSFSAVTTAYAVIALQGKFLPLHIFSGGSSSSQTFPFRIEGSTETVCAGKAAGPTALDVVKNASTSCGFTYNIQSTSFGPYLNQINGDTASGQTGWIYLINNIGPSVGMADYQMKGADAMLLYFGDFAWQPTMISLSSSEISSGQQGQTTIEYFDGNNWNGLSGATVYYGANTDVTDSLGKASLSPQDGYYKIYAQKTGFVRSNSWLLKVGQPTSGAVNLTVNVGNGSVQGTSTAASGIAFSVDPTNLDFGNLAAGATASKNIIITNTGSSGIHAETIVTGDSVFFDNLSLSNARWQNFKVDVGSGTSQNVAASLTVPKNYSANGQKTGQLVFWAMAQ